MNFPRTALLTFGGNVTAAGLTPEAALNAAGGDVSRASMQIDVAGCGFLDLNIAAPGATFHRARNLTRPDIARSGLQSNLARKIGELQIARTGFRLHIPVGTLDDLIAGAGACDEHRIHRHADLVVHGDVLHVVIEIVNVTVITLLPNLRLLLDLVDIGVTIAAQPAVTDEDLSSNEDGSRRTGANRHVAGMSEHFKIDGTTHRQRLFK